MAQLDSTFHQAAVEASGGGTRVDGTLHQAAVEASGGGRQECRDAIGEYLHQAVVEASDGGAHLEALHLFLIDACLRGSQPGCGRSIGWQCVVDRSFRWRKASVT